MNLWRMCGDNVVNYPMAKILKPGNITLGSNIIIDDFVFIGAHEELIVSNYVHIASHASITGGGSFRVGDFCNLSSGVRILTGTDLPRFAGHVGTRSRRPAPSLAAQARRSSDSCAYLRLLPGFATR